MMVPINWHDLGYLTPELVVVLGAFVVLALDLVVPKGSKRVLGWAGIVTLLLAMGAVYSQWSQTGAPQPIFGTLVRDLYSLFFDVVFLLSGLLGILVSLRYVENAGVSRGGYYSLILFAVLGMMLMAASTELLTLFISYEILSLSVYVLSGIARARAEAAEASMKYFLLGAFSSGFLIYGIALVYGATGNTGLEAIRGYVAQHGLTGNALLLIGLALITIGFAFKVAVVPFHVWVPDVYQGAPLPVTAFMSAGVKAAAFAVLARVLFTGFPGLVGTWQPVLWVLAVLTMILGNTSAIPQENIKRMLAYSSIAHAGYMLVALSAFSAGEVALGSLLYYGLVYTVMNIGAFAVVLLVGRAGEENQRLVDYHGLSVRSPWLAGAMGLFMASLAGLPPTAGFLGKFYVLNAALRAGQTSLAVVLVLASVVSWYYYLRVVWLMYFEPAKEGGEPVARSVTLGAAVAVAGILVLVLGILPTAWLNLAQVAGSSLTGGLPLLRLP